VRRDLNRRAAHLCWAASMNDAPVLLAVLAHPDDESFRCGGTLALLARRGVRVQVLTATRGQAGSCGEPPLCRPDELPAVRECELRCACAALGVLPPILLDYEDGHLSEATRQSSSRRFSLLWTGCDLK